MRSSTLTRLVVVVGLVVSIFGLVMIAQAKPNPEAVLTCGSEQYTVSGFGRGEPLHVSGSTSNYVVTYARVEPDGPVIIDIKGQQDKEDIVTCTATSPLSGRSFTFQGFFTSRGDGHDPEL